MVDLVLEVARGAQHRLHRPARLRRIARVERFRQRVERARRRRDARMDLGPSLPGVRLRFDDHVGGALGGRAAVGMGVEGVGVFRRDQPLLLKMREHGWLQRLRCPRHHHVRLPPAHDRCCLGDGGEPASLRPCKPHHRPAYAQRSRDELPVGHEQGRLAGRAKREAVGHGEAPRVGDARRQPRRLHRLQGGVEAHHRAAVEEVGEVPGDAWVGAVVVGDGPRPEGRGAVVGRPVNRGRTPCRKRLPHPLDPAAVRGHGAVAGHDRFGEVAWQGLGWELWRVAQLVEVLIKKVVDAGAAAHHHHYGGGDGEKNEEGENALHS